LNRPPQIVAPRSTRAALGEAVVLNACASTDPDGDSLAFLRRDASGAALGSDCTLALPARRRPGQVRLTLELSDGQVTRHARFYARWLPRPAVPKGPRH
jgi:hypothetical protein